MATFILVIFIQLFKVAEALQIVALSANCSGADTTACGPGSLCCPSGFTCSARRGIPTCVNLRAPAPLIGYDHQPCLDPYYFTCDVLDIPGFCCPIGSMCTTNNGNNLDCVDAYGSTTSAILSATMNSSPTKTPTPEDNSKITYAPANAWKVSDNRPDCSIGRTIYTTDIINATISFNYTGPSVTVHTVTSLNGGVFNVWVDGFDTQTTIDTSGYFSDGSAPTPQCFPLQFPPFVVSPPDFISDPPGGHSITLVYNGSSPFAPNGTNSNATIQFNSFSIPGLDISQTSSYMNTVYGRFTLFPMVLVYFMTLIF